MSGYRPPKGAGINTRASLDRHPPSFPSMSFIAPNTKTVDIRAWPIWNSFIVRATEDLNLLKIGQYNHHLDPQRWQAAMPAGFPHSPLQMVRLLDWEERGDQHPWQYTLRHTPPSAPYRTAKWTAYGKPRCATFHHLRIGHVEIDPLIYELPATIQERLQVTNGQMILYLMMESVARGRNIRLAVEVQRVVGPTTGYEEVVVARYLPHEEAQLPSAVFEVFMKQPSVPRACADYACRRLLPQGLGPSRCLHHIVTPPGY
ncbi:hypothetical protein FB45DRAFT_932805 [Roridomyces roridus]|uniref:Uncharacterized protein n=1 Tax=Roridomyces roridus TaxID=1738132 RepID=A0AAD7BE38_9AGAR|nr:hypothetical protein FB45DRAFT_932805 [Roridomyces roridus]